MTAISNHGDSISKLLSKKTWVTLTAAAEEEVHIDLTLKASRIESITNQMSEIKTFKILFETCIQDR